ncbi:MAG: M3 family oligoendopeptidase [Bacteroidia bacterium]|nr:M3 family oligoendopeptidase [Bacteroidia bacterium]
MELTADTVRLKTRFVPTDLDFSKPESVTDLFRELEQRPLSSSSEFIEWLRDYSELESVLHEELAWRYIRSSCNTADTAAEAAYDFFVSEIEPLTAPWFQKLNKRLISSPFVDALNPEEYFVFLRGVRNDIALYREENIPLFTKIDQLSQQFGKIAGAQTIDFRGKELTMPQAAAKFKSTDENERREVFEKIAARRMQDRSALDKLFTELAEVRNEVALNCGYGNFRDYSFAAMGRFDYTKEDCFRFHEAVEEHVLPVIEELNSERAQQLGKLKLRPYDKDVDPLGRPPLAPFHGGKELLNKTLKVFGRLYPDWKSRIALMNEMGHFDLDSRKNKAPGGYNYSLPISGAPFIFMNAADSHGDLITMVHEAGHAFHSFRMNDLTLYSMKNPPSEVCELASMSMELITMDAWDEFYPNAEDAKRSQRDQLEKVVSGLAWIATIDAFQHWLYENHGHTIEQREEAWLRISSRFESKLIDWSGYEEYRNCAWQKQLHIFEVPFYYIEYGIAQLGAIAVWREYRKNATQSITAYEDALSLGYKVPISKIFEAAGVKFDFSAAYVKELMQFLKDELHKLR